MLHPAFLSVASPRVVAAWDQLLHEDSFAALPPARHRARPARRRLSLAALLAAALALGLVAALVALASAGAGARLAAARVQQASQGEDPAALQPLADWPALRANLAAGLLASLPAAPPRYLEELAQDVADGLASAGPLHALLQDRLGHAAAAGLPWPADGGWRVRLGSGALLRFARGATPGAGWVLVDIALPEPTDD